MSTKNLKVTLKTGEEIYCYGVKKAAEASGVLEETIRYSIQVKGCDYNKNGLKIEEVESFNKLEIKVDTPTRVIVRGDVVKE